MSRYMTITIKVPMIKSIAINSTLFVILLIIIYFLLKNTSETNYGYYLFYNLVVLSLGLLVGIFNNLIELLNYKKKSFFVWYAYFMIICSIFSLPMIILLMLIDKFETKEHDIFVLSIFGIICLTLYIIFHTLKYYKRQKIEYLQKQIFEKNTKD